MLRCTVIRALKSGLAPRMAAVTTQFSSQRVHAATPLLAQDISHLNLLAMRHASCGPENDLGVPSPRSVSSPKFIQPSRFLPRQRWPPVAAPCSFESVPLPSPKPAVVPKPSAAPKSGSATHLTKDRLKDFYLASSSVLKRLTMRLRKRQERASVQEVINESKKGDKAMKNKEQK